MQIQNFLAWLSWDPNPDVFILPYLNHPLKWYGLFFMGGFFVGFFIIFPILQKKLLDLKVLMPRDIANWNILTDFLRNSAKDKNAELTPVLNQLDKKTRQDILNKEQTLEPESQKNVLKAFTSTLQDPKGTLDRKQLESLIPKAFNSIKEISYKYIDQLVWFIVLGTIIGARLGHVFFYEWPRYKDNLIDIAKIWEGGLASHGGTIGVLIAIFLYILWTKKKFPEITFLRLCDMLTIPVAFVAVCIRLGNFMNQEILGKPSELPWAILFVHPADGSIPVPRHPVQLYEAMIYLASFFILRAIWKAKASQLAPGFMLGIFFVLIFGTRFFIDFLKEPQSLMLDESYLQTGQLLSVPFALLGLFLMFRETLCKKIGFYSWKHS